jgi:hypothetical protein
MLREDAMARSTDLRSDDRGAFMVMGIFLSLVLVGALWSIAGTGQAILFRERMQEAADAAALGAAAVDARAMNTIVLLNLTLTAVMSVRTTIMAMLIVSNALGFQTIAPSESVTYPNLEAMAPVALALHAKYDPDITEAITKLNAAQIGIATATPPVAASSATEMSYFYEPTGMQSTATLVEGTPAATGGALPIALPTNTTSLSAVCGVANRLAVPGLGNPPPPPPMIQAFVATAPVDLTAGVNGVVGTVDDLMYKDTLCEPTVSPNATIPQTTDVNGGSNCQIFTSVGTQGLTSNLATDLIQFANSRGVAVDMSTPSLTANASFAEAEFFFDCVGTWDACESVALFNFLWRPRFRLYNPGAAALATLPPNAIRASELASETELKARLLADQKAMGSPPLSAQLSKDLDPGLAGISMVLH